MRRPTIVPRLPRPTTLLAVAIALVLAAGVAPILPASPVAAGTAGTAESVEARLVALVNADRVARGLVAYRTNAALGALSGDRAAALAAQGVLSHSVAGCLSCQLESRNIQWYGFGEALGVTSYPLGEAAATSLYEAWKGSPTHWGLLMSPTYNYIGVGVALAASANTYASIVLTESIDQTRPWARMASKSVRGTTIAWTWKGADYRLQTHTAGLKNFDVQYRVGSGTFKTIRSGSTATALTLTGRTRGRWYGIRVRSRDNRGLLSAWTPELRVWVP
jgi:uncharacterized protein YkwD